MAEGQGRTPYNIGTQRPWQAGTALKVCENSAFTSGWWLITDLPEWLQVLLPKMDQLGNSICRYKNEIDGELWLKKIISEFNAPSGDKYTLEQFTQYKGHFGAANYSFKNVFTSKYFSDKIALQEEINNALVSANEREFENSGKGEYNDRKIYLSPEQIKTIKDRVKQKFKNDSSLDPRDVHTMDELLKNVNKYLEQGTNFEGNEKEIYDKNNAIKNDFIYEYLPLKEKKEIMKSAIQEIDDNFADNWGVKESFRKQFKDQFNKYIDKYLQRIKKDELENFQKELGCDLNAPIDVFYSHLNQLAGKNQINVYDYIGKKIPSPNNKYEDVELLEIEDYYIICLDSNKKQQRLYVGKDAENEVKKLIQSRQVGDLQIPLQIRFQELYHKDLTGDWDFNEAVSLKKMEQLFNFVPEGHLLNNEQIKQFDKSDSFSSDDGYAYFNSKKSEIFLSEKCLKESSNMMSLSDGNQFASVMLHEIGHAVSYKLGGRNVLAYKKFGYQAGWDWDQYRNISVRATGNDKDIPRNSPGAHVPLITKYAAKSPEEAFAEYYSFYSQYKHNIDNFLDHKDTNGLKLHEDQSVITSVIDHLHNLQNNLTYKDYVNSSNSLAPKTKKNMDAVLLSNHKDISDHIESNVLDPWKTKKHSNIENLSIDKQQVAYNLKYNRDQQIQPVFSIKYNGDYLLNNDSELNINEANKYLKKYTPTYSISHEAYTLLSQAAFSDSEISSYTLNHLEHQKIPAVTREDQLKKTLGLRYCQKVVPFETLIKNENIFREMRNIYHSEELKKALDDLFNKDNKDTINIEKSDSSELKPTSKKRLVSLFKKYIFDPLAKSFNGTDSNLIENIVDNYNDDVQQYADVICLNQENQILLLQRASTSKFQPLKWCLPGGHVDPAEEFEVVAIREMLEETNLIVQPQFICEAVKTNPDCVIQYFFSEVNQESYNIILNPTKHCGYAWVNINDLDQYDLMLDLGSTLDEIFSPEVSQTIKSQDQEIMILDHHDAFDLIKKSYEDSLISDEDYFNALQKYNQVIEKSQQDLLSIDEKLDQGIITNEELFNLVKSKEALIGEVHKHQDGFDYKKNLDGTWEKITNN